MSSAATSRATNVALIQAQPLRLRSSDGQALVGEVDSGEPARRECLRHNVDGMAAAATDVGDIDAAAQLLRQAVGQRKDDADERGVEDLAALFGHQLVEARIFAVGQTAAVVEAADDLLLHLAEQ